MLQTLPPDQLPTVSIITVVFNGFDYLEATLQSILSQTYEHVEYIVIDGGSNDGTVDIIQKYATQIAYWISEPDAGIYDAMNKGLRAAKGDYVLFINAGDQLNSNITLSSVFYSLPAGADVIYGETHLIDESGKVLGTRSALSTRKLPEKLKYQDMRYGMAVSHQSFMVKRDMAPSYEASYRCSADIDWVIRALKKSKKTVNAQVVIAKYLVGGFSIRQRRLCWKERFQVYKTHFGLPKTLLAHVWIVLRYVVYKISGRQNH
jgi:glycosyltransferase involved in cell wall biosynthesis